MPALKATEAKKLVRRILEDGEIRFVAHALEAMAKRNVTAVDVENILRGGVCREAEYENGGWRHHIDTPKIVVVFSFEPEPASESADEIDAEETKVVVITVWKVEKR